MKDIILAFPGQGSQYVGMGRNAENFQSFKRFKEADNILQYTLSEICFEGPDSQLKLTKHTQPAIVTYSIILFEELKKRLDEKGLKVSKVMGHSVGEYSALVAAGCLNFEDAVKAVHLRGKYMQESTPEGVGAMMAILKLDNQIVKKACDEVSTETEQVSVANYNDPTQTVISGHIQAVEKAKAWLDKNSEQRFRGVMLPVSAPFHCPLMMPAQNNMSSYLESITFNDLELPYVANIDAKEYPQGTKSEQIKENLVKQISGSVLWTQSIQGLSENSIVIECGPGKVLKGLIRKTRNDIQVYSLDQDSFDFIDELEI